MAKFGATADNVIVPYGSYETYINDTFYSGSIKVTTECRTAADIVLLKGLIDVLHPGEFDDVYKYHLRWGISIFDGYQGDVSEMIEADSGYFPNFPEYEEYGNTKEDPWQGENVIKVGVDRYWGFANPSRILSRRGWEDKLRLENNNLMRRLGRPERSQSDRIPAFLNKEKIQIKFLNVPTIAMALFDFGTQ